MGNGCRGKTEKSNPFRPPCTRGAQKQKSTTGHESLPVTFEHDQAIAENPVCEPRWRLLQIDGDPRTGKRPARSPNSSDVGRRPADKAKATSMSVLEWLVPRADDPKTSA